MKSVKIILSMVCLGAISCGPLHAQDARQAKKAARQAAIKTAIDNKDFVFTAEFAEPLRGGNIYINSVYDLKVRNDSLITYLPYYGVAYVAPVDPLNGGIKFTSTKFSYISAKKKNGYQIVIKPSNTADVRQMVLDVGLDGYTTLSINNRDRDAIRFSGHIDGAAKAKSN